MKYFLLPWMALVVLFIAYGCAHAQEASDNQGTKIYVIEDDIKQTGKLSKLDQLGPHDRATVTQDLLEDQQEQIRQLQDQAAYDLN